MGDSCIIFCAAAEHSAVSDIVHEIFADEAISVNGEPSDWTRIKAKSLASTLILTSVTPSSPNHQLENLFQQTDNCFAQIQPEAVDQKKAVLQKIRSCTFAITAETTSYSFVGRNLECLFAIALETDGILFNGACVIDHHGYILLDQNGNRDHLIQGG